MAGPDFTNLGVTDPTTGKPVFLTPQNMATVLGATGGVAPTQFQAGVEGAFKGVEAGQKIYGNFQDQQINSQVIDANEIKNNIARQTQDARILAENNRIKQQAIQTQIQTESLTNENSILTAIRSGDPNQLITAISDPKLITEAIKYNPEIEAVASRLQGSFTPEQAQKLSVFRTTNSIYKNGDLQTQYNTAGKAVAGLPEVQQLQQMSGIPMDQLLAQMTTGQAQRGVDPNTGAFNANIEGGMVLVSPTGHKVTLPEKDNDTTSKLLPPFFSARQQVSSPGPLKLPQSFGAAPAPQQQAAPATEAGPAAAVTEKTLPPVNAEGKTYSQTLYPEPGTTQAPAPEQTQVNPNAVSPLGVPLRTNIPQLNSLNTKTTSTGTPLQAAIDRRAQQLFTEGQKFKDAYNQASKEMLKKAPLTARLKDKTTDTQTLAEQKRLMADEIDQVVANAEEISFPLGSTWGSTAGRVVSNIEDLGTSIDTVRGGEPDERLKNVKSSFDSLSSRYSLNVMASSGMGTKVFDSNTEGERLLKQGPAIINSAAENKAVAVRLRSEAQALENENTIAQTLDTLGIEETQITNMVKLYHKENPVNIFDPVSGRITLNPKKVNPTEWVYEKLGIPHDQAVKETFSTPTVVPKPTEKSPAAAGSGTSQPFSPAQKTPASGFPAPPLAKDVRGGNYDTTPASQKDIHAIADTAAAGGNIRQFQTGSSVPRKLDKATPDLMARLVGAESSGNIHAVSPIKRDANGKIVSGGVEGLAQVTQATFREVANDPALLRTVADTGESDQDRANRKWGSPEFNPQLSDRELNARRAFNPDGTLKTKEPATDLGFGNTGETYDAESAIAEEKALKSGKPFYFRAAPKEFHIQGKKQGPMQPAPTATPTPITLNNRKDPRQSLTAGTAYMNKMLKRYDGNVDFALAGYNAGPGAVDAAIEQAGTSNARGTIDQIAPYLPKTQPTEKYVKRITSRGRVSEQSEQAQPGQKNPGFFDNFSIDQLNPFGASMAEAEEFTPEKTVGEPPAPGEPDNRKVSMVLPGEEEPTEDAQPLTPEEQTQLQQGISKGLGNPMKFDESQIPTTGTKAAVPKMDTAPRGDIPPVSEVTGAIEALKTGIKDAGLGTIGRGVKFIRNSALGKWIGAKLLDQEGEIAGVPTGKIFANAESFVNAALMDFYDEGMSMIPGLDGDVVQKEIRENVAKFHKENPKLAVAADILGFAAANTGALKLARGLGMLKGAAQAATKMPSAINPMTFKEGVAIGAATSGAAGVGAGTTLGDRAVGGLEGVVMGAAGGTLASVIPKIPGGGAAVLGAGIGAVSEGLTGGSVEGGALKGAGIGLAGGLGVKYSPLVQKILTGAVFKLNNQKGLQTLANMLHKTMTSKTAEEAAMKFTPVEATMADQLWHLGPKKLQGIVDEITKLQKNNPQIPAGLIDKLTFSNNAKSFIRMLGQLQDHPVMVEKINEQLSTRMGGQANRLKAALGAPEDVETIGRQLVNTLNDTLDSAYGEATTLTKPMYKKAEKAVPQFKSAEIDELLTVPDIQEAVGKAKEYIKAPKSVKTTPKNISDLSDEIAERLDAGEQVDDILDDLHETIMEDFNIDPSDVKAMKAVDDQLDEAVKVTKNKPLADNDHEVLARARRVLRDEIIPDTKDVKLKKDRVDLEKRLKTELERLSEDYKKANIEQTVIKGKVDALKGKLLKPILDLKDGKPGDAIQKMMDLPNQDLKKVMKAVEISPVFKENPDVFKETAKKYLLNKVNKAIEGKDVSKNLISDKEFINIETLLGKQEADALRGMVNAERDLARTGSSLSGQSATASNLSAAAKIAETAGETKEPFHTLSQVVAGSKAGTMARTIRYLFGKVTGQSDPKILDEMVETLFIDLPKGKAVAEKTLKAMGLQESEIKAMKPYLSEWQDALRGTGAAIPSSFTSEMRNKKAADKGKKKK